MTNPEPTPATLQLVIEEYTAARRAARMSERTLEDYGTTFRRFLQFIGPNTQFSEITPQRVRIFLGGFDSVSDKTVLNYYIALSSLWTWACKEGYAPEHIIQRVEPPDPEDRVITPLSLEDVKKLLAALDKDKIRNKAIILFLLDTGVRASELGGLRIKDLQGSEVIVFGKGSKERQIPLSRRALKTLGDYLMTRGKLKQSDPLFAVASGKPINRNTLKKMVSRLGVRAGVNNVHPHRFRHTFALQFLRNGGDAITLQKLLGHTSLDMVKKYVDIANDDAQFIHQRASPVENWGL